MNASTTSITPTISTVLIPDNSYDVGGQAPTKSMQRRTVGAPRSLRTSDPFKSRHPLAGLSRRDRKMKIFRARAGRTCNGSAADYGYPKIESADDAERWSLYACKSDQTLRQQLMMSLKSTVVCLVRRRPLPTAPLPWKLCPMNDRRTLCVLFRHS